MPVCIYIYVLLYYIRRISNEIFAQGSMVIVFRSSSDAHNLQHLLLFLLQYWYWLERYSTFIADRGLALWVSHRLSTSQVPLSDLWVVPTFCLSSEDK